MTKSEDNSVQIVRMPPKLRELWSKLEPTSMRVMSQKLLESDGDFVAMAAFILKNGELLEDGQIRCHAPIQKVQIRTGWDWGPKRVKTSEEADPTLYLHKVQLGKESWTCRKHDYRCNCLPNGKRSNCPTCLAADVDMELSAYELQHCAHYPA